jgi:hypothetical protein
LLYRAISLTEAGEYNNALTSWTALKTENALETTELANQMIKVLSGKQDTGSISDQEKYYRMRYMTKDPDLKTALSINDNYIRDNAVLFLAEKKIHSGDYITAEQILGNLSGESNSLQLQRQHFLTLIKMRSGRLNKPEHIPAGLLSDHPVRLFWKAVFQELKHADKKQNDSLYLAAGNLHAFDEAVLAGVSDYFIRKKEASRIYDLVQKVAASNPENPQYLKIYALVALHNRFSTYAEEAIQRLKQMIPPDEFMQFEKGYAEEVKRLSLDSSVWQ